MSRVVMVALSDVHARQQLDADESVRTWARPERVSPTDNPLIGLAEYVRSEGLQADVLLCPGDLCDQADWDALPYAWDHVQAIAAALGDAQVVATLGNHDIDSFAHHAPAGIADGPQHNLGDYPTVDSAARDEFWASRVAVVRGSLWQVVVLNSTMMRHLDAGERDCGMVDDGALEAVQAAITAEERSVNVLLCHHHPMQWPRLNPDDKSEMERGGELVQLLNDHGHSWVVIHGHRHQPHLEYLPGESDAPVRLACGSIGARLSGILASHVNNQMHVIEFHVGEAKRLGLPLAGLVRSHTWRPSTGWERAGDHDGLPFVSGFGFRQGAAVPLANQLVNHATELHVPALERAEMIAVEPRLPYLMPGDIRKLSERLRTNHHCTLSRDDDGQLDRLKLPVL